MPRTRQAVREDLAHKERCAQDIIERADKENRVTSADENTIFDKLMSEIDTLKNELKQLDEYDKRRELMDAMREERERSNRVASANPIANAVQAVATSGGQAPNYFRRDGRLRAFTGANTREAEEKAYRSGMWLRAYVFGDHRAARWCENHGVRNAMGTTSNPDGGFLVPEEFSQTIIDLREQYGVFRANCEVVPMGRDTMTVPRRLTGITIGPVGENPSSAISQSNPTWNQVRLTAKKAGGLCLMSTEIAEDAVIRLADWVANEFGYAFALFEDQCGFTGDTTSTYLGINGLTNILTTASSLAGAVAAASGHDTFAEIDSSDLAKVMGALPAYVRNPKWYCSKMAAEMIFGRLQQNAGGNTIGDLTTGLLRRSYCGAEIVISQVLPASTSTINGTAMLFYGDLALSSTLGDRRDVAIFPSEHRYMDTDQIGIRGTARFDIVNHDYGTTAAGVTGPIVGLMGTT